MKYVQNNQYRNSRYNLANRKIGSGFMKRFIVVWILAFFMVSVVQAQDAPTPAVVTAEAEDGLILQGDFYMPTQSPELGAPAVILMHMLGSSRRGFEPLIPALLEEGYAVLNIDLRGHGDTGGSRDWQAATTDVQTWLNWLYEQPDIRPDSVSLIGASISSNLALIGCANDSTCLTVIALSPGLDYYGLMPEQFIIDGLRERSALLIAAYNDFESIDSVRQMASNARGEIGLRLFTGSAHGTEFFGRLRERTTAIIIAWLNEHQPEA